MDYFNSLPQAGRDVNHNQLELHEAITKIHNGPGNIQKISTIKVL